VDTTVLLVFGLVYLGMVVGRLPGLALDRTGVALLGAIVLIGTERISPAAAWEAVDVPTMALLLGLMVVSAQLRLGGMYAEITRRIARARLAPRSLLLAVIGVSALLSAVVANDIVCLAMTPVLAAGCIRRGLKPVPFLLALACAANVGSAATLIGNPQNMLIGQTLHLPFAAYLLDSLVPAVLGCLATWWVICRVVGTDWYQAPKKLRVEATPFDPWQSFKGAAVVVLLMICFLLSDWPREALALVAAGVLMTSRKMHSRDVLGLVDWPLLVLFGGLFVVNHAVAAAGIANHALVHLAGAGVDLARPVWLFVVTVILSNLVSNVPAVMLLLPAASHSQAGAILALASTLAGNLFLVGSIANLIVVDQAERIGIPITWRDHARVGVPVTLATLAIAAGWLWLRAFMG
jgi:Na+/H+ antiporter NhaD/arsenite permease-like protein